MISLNNYIKINEAIDPDTLIYKIDTWFARNDNERIGFNALLSKLKKSNIVDKKSIDDYLDTSKLQLKSFVDYATDNIFGNEVQDYNYVFTKIISTLVANKQL